MPWQRGTAWRRTTSSSAPPRRPCRSRPDHGPRPRRPPSTRRRQRKKPLRSRRRPSSSPTCQSPRSLPSPSRNRRRRATRARRRRWEAPGRKAEMPDITAAMVKALRESTGAGMMDCKRALIEADGDAERATQLLREKGLASQAKRAGRNANQGLIDAYIHFNNTVGVLVEVNCETDFVANTDEFRHLVKDLALHIASPSAPRWVTRDDVPTPFLESEQKIAEAQARESGKPDTVVPKIVEGKIEAFLKDNVLLDQPFVKDDSKTIQQYLDEVSAKTGEKVQVKRFARFRLGEDAE